MHNASAACATLGRARAAISLFTSPSFRNASKARVSGACRKSHQSPCPGCHGMQVCPRTGFQVTGKTEQSFGTGTGIFRSVCVHPAYCKEVPERDADGPQTMRSKNCTDETPHLDERSAHWQPHPGLIRPLIRSKYTDEAVDEVG